MNQPTLRDKMYIIIVNWKLPDDTIECVQTLLKASAASRQILIVDNGSGDDSVEKLQAEFGDSVQILQSAENLGFAGGNNWAIEHALREGAEWVLLANNDTVVAPTFIAELSETVQNYRDYTIIAPLIFYYGQDSDLIWSLGGRLIPGTLATRQLLRNKPMPTDLPQLMPVDCMNACGLLIHRTVFEQIGVLDTSYFMYAEDVDFCWRARLVGVKLGCATRAHMWHKVSRSTGVNTPAYRYWSIANQIRFYRRYATLWQLPIMLAFTLLQCALMLVRDLFAGRVRIVPTVARAWVDGWFRKNLAQVSV